MAGDEMVNGKNMGVGGDSERQPVRRKAQRSVARASRDVIDLGKSGGVSPPDKEWLSLKDVAQYFSMSIDYARRSWVEWIDQGVNPMRLNGNAKGALRFKKSEIVVLAERWRVQQD